MEEDTTLPRILSYCSALPQALWLVNLQLHPIWKKNVDAPDPDSDLVFAPETVGMYFIWSG